MQCKIDRILEKIARGETVFGSHAAWGGAMIAEIYGTIGFDAIWIDTEHGNIDKTALLHTFIGADTTPMAKFVRVAWNDPVLVKPVLDLGADGIIFPMVLTADDARRAVAACRYPPEGVRGFGPGRAVRYGAIDAMDYIEEYSRNIFVIIQIEHIEAVKNFDEILKVPGIGAFILGPFDLSGSMGMLGRINSPEVKKVMDEIAAKAKAAGIPFGASMGYSDEIANDWAARGANFMFCDNENTYLYGGGSATLEKLRRAVNKNKK